MSAPSEGVTRETDAADRARAVKLRVVLIGAALLLGLILYEGFVRGVARYLHHRAVTALGDQRFDAGVRFLRWARWWPGAHHDIGWLLARNAYSCGDRGHAGGLLQELLADDRRTPEVLDALGRLAEESGDFERAQELYRRLAREEPGSLAAALGLARLPAPLADRNALTTLLEGLPPRRPGPPEFRGVALFHLKDDLGARGYGTPAAAEALLDARRHGARQVSIRVPGLQASVADTAISFGRDRPGAENDREVRRVIRDAHRLGLSVLLKPHIMLGRITDTEWRGTIDFEETKRLDEWWQSYRRFILHYARLANAEGVELFSVGVELRGLARRDPSRWSRLIRDVRAVYAGRITYAANWYHEYEEVEFWEDVDLIGIQFFFPLSEEESPTREEILIGLRDLLPSLEALAGTHGKPVLFTEVGYKSMRGATREPWQWPAHRHGRPDPELQARAYRAILETFQPRPWFAGLFWWNWLSDPAPGEKFDRDFTPQGKPAAAVLAEAWTESR